MEPWEILWDRAMLAIDSLKGFDHIDWSFGGGTAMRLVYDHRESRDIDLFLTDTSVLSALSPRLNSVTERFTNCYTEQSNFLKLNFPEGEIDFILAGRLVDDVAFEKRSVRDRLIDFERPIEVVAKKCFFRADQFTARDMFDLAVIMQEEPDVVHLHRALLLAKRDQLRLRMARAQESRDLVQSQLDAIAAMPRFESIKPKAIDMVCRFVEQGEIES